ncbi:hypothetical protein AMS68_006147 [Peltaster fructicola]|uniref:Uncharacterized protein n=1 Tax=Peltaster fructicola TaxID=286661 RepID=A0A6H0Y1W0_9PEZI|nr:hypothetical protein AMS68_006147 [Peltaster fructicola]
MQSWDKLVSWLKQSSIRLDEEIEPLLTADGNASGPTTSPRDVTIVCLRLKYQIEQVIPCELPEERITAAHSNVITQAVVKTAQAAGTIADVDNSACVVFGLLVVKNWFRKQAKLELWDADLHNGRAQACEVIAKKIIEGEDDHDYLMREVLLKRFSIIVDGKPTLTSNVIEKAVDLHAVRVIGSSGYQRCVNWLLRGWMCPVDGDPDRFVEYDKKTSPHFLDHFDPGRMRVPLYQTAVAIIFSIVYLILYTIAINTINPDGNLDGVEILMYLFTLGFIFDEAVKFWKVGIKYLAFWNVFHTTLYSLLTVSFVVRIISLQYEPYSEQRDTYSQLSYNFLAFTAPFFWMRLLLFLDGYQFFGTMLVVIKMMMKESAIFFALLSLVLIGFLQAFIGLDMNDDSQTATSFILQQMTNGILGSPEFDGWDRFAPPFGLILFYMYNFIIIVVLLNVLIALYNSAYSDVTDNAVDEYMALFSHKVVQAQRAPDENVYIAPFNLIETFLISFPFEWWMTKQQYSSLNYYVMGVLYAPALLVTAYLETRDARQVLWNRRHHQIDEDTTEEWEQMLDELDVEGSGWQKRVEETSPNVAVDATLLELRALRKEIDDLRDTLKVRDQSSDDKK